MSSRVLEVGCGVYGSCEGCLGSCVGCLGTYVGCFWGHVQGVRGHMECVGCLRFKCVGGENGMYSVGCLRNVWSAWECVSVVCGQQDSWQTACSHGLLSFR